MSDQLKDVQTWQAEHVTEHAVNRLTRGVRLERRREQP
jgi:macrodomain Ter protein organizer (MatP/YcbG family)